jgi:hypothetical protein
MYSTRLNGVIEAELGTTSATLFAIHMFVVVAISIEFDQFEQSY